MFFLVFGILLLGFVSAGWSDEHEVVQWQFDVNYPVANTGPNGDLYVIYNADFIGSSPAHPQGFRGLVLKRIDRNGNLVLNHTPLVVPNVANSSAGAKVGKYFDFDIDSSGNIYLVWVDYRNTNIFYQNAEVMFRAYNAYGQPLTSEVSLPVLNRPVEDSHIRITPQNDLAVTWKELPNTQQPYGDGIYFSKIDFQGNVVVNKVLVSSSNVNARASDMEVDSQGNTHVVWSDNTRDVRYGKVNPNGNVLVSDMLITTPDPDPNIFKYSAKVEIDGNDVPFIFYEWRNSTHPDYYHNAYEVVKLDNNNVVHLNRWRNGIYAVSQSPEFEIDEHYLNVIAKEYEFDYMWKTKYYQMDHEGNLLADELVEIVPNGAVFFAYSALTIDNDGYPNLFSRTYTGNFIPRIIHRSRSPMSLEWSGSPNLGGTIFFDMGNKFRQGVNYIMALSLGNTGINVGDGRVIPIDADQLYYWSVDGVNTPKIGLNPGPGVLDSSGNAQASLVIANNSMLSNETFYAAFVTINSQTGSILDISDSVEIHIG